MLAPGGHEYQWPIILNSESYIVASQNGRPMWEVAQIGEVAGKGPVTPAEEYMVNSWHGGFGFTKALYPHTYRYAQGADARFPNVIFEGPLITSTSGLSTACSGFFEQSSKVYLLDARYCREITFTFGDGTTANDSATVATPDSTGGSTGRDFTAGHSPSMAINWDGYTVVAFSTADNMQKFTGSAWSSCNLTGSYLAKLWMDPNYSLVRNASTTAIDYIAQSADVTDITQWGTNYTIGDTSGTITAIVGAEEDLYVAKTDGLYGFDRGFRTPPIIRVPANANNGKQTFVDTSGRIWYPASGSLFLYDPTTNSINDVHPGKGHKPDIGLGRVTAMAQWRDWYFASVDNGGNTLIFAGRDRNESDQAPGIIIWHGSLNLGSTVNTNVNAMFVSTVPTYPVMLLACNNTTFKFFRLNSTECPLDDANYRYTNAGAQLYGCESDFGLPSGYWQASAAMIESVVPSTHQLELLVHKDSATATTSLVTITSSARTRQTITSDYRFSTAGLYISISRSSGSEVANTVEIYSMTLQANRRASVNDFITTHIICDDRVFSKLGVPARDSAKDMLTNLKALATAAPVTLKDEWTGSERSRTVLVQPVEEKMVKLQGFDNAVSVAVVKMLVLA